MLTPQSSSEEKNPVPKAALVTGAAKRIGRAIALDLADAGYAVAVHYNASVEDAEDLVNLIKARDGKAISLRADLTREADVRMLMNMAVEALGPIGCLVNNASVFEYDAPETATRESWDEHMEANLRAPFVLMQQMTFALPQDAGGVIINLLDERVWALTPHFTTYTLSKVGLWALTQTLALSLAPRIRVNGIGPGPALPNKRQTDEQFAKQAASVPLKRPTSPREICRTIRYILDAPSMTGQMIALDGGQHLGWGFPEKARFIEE